MAFLGVVFLVSLSGCVTEKWRKHRASAKARAPETDFPIPREMQTEDLGAGAGAGALNILTDIVYCESEEIIS